SFIILSACFITAPWFCTSSAASVPKNTITNAAGFHSASTVEPLSTVPITITTKPRMVPMMLILSMRSGFLLQRGGTAVGRGDQARQVHHQRQPSVAGDGGAGDARGVGEQRAERLDDDVLAPAHLVHQAAEALVADVQHHHVAA